MKHGAITNVRDHGTIWLVEYRGKDNTVGIVPFEHRPFSYFYQRATGRDFFSDYRFDMNRSQVGARLNGLRISVDESEYPPTVALEGGNQ